MTLGELKMLGPAEKRNNLLRRIFNLLRKHKKLDLSLQSSYGIASGGPDDLNILCITYKNNDTNKFTHRKFNARLFLDESGGTILDTCSKANSLPKLEDKIVLRIAYLLWKDQQENI